RRALVMVVIAGWLVLDGRLASPWQGWLLALGLVLVLDPLAALDQGFWLSFGAVAVLILVFSRRQGRPGFLPALVLAQAAVFAGLWPVLAVLDQGAAWTGLLANIVAIPWLSLLVMPLLLVAGILVAVTGEWLAVPLAFLLDGVLGGLWWVLTTLAGLELPAGRLPVWLAAAFAAAVLVALWVPDRRLRLACALVAATALLAGAGAAGNRWQDVPRIWIWDVGQGLSVLLHHQDRTLLYDTGPEAASGYNAVSEVLIPSLERLAVRRLDTVVVSHGDRDHAGGLDALFGRYSPGLLVAGERDRLPEAHTDSATPCQEQPPVQVGEVDVRFWQDQTASGDANDRSCVAVLEYAGQLVLLPGDISAGTEQRLLQAWPWLAGRPGELTLVAPHHGSKTSSGAGFVQTLAPERVIFTAGYRHRYGHPHPDVVTRYHQAGSELYNTATAGALRLDLLPEGVTVTPWRERAAFWLRGPEPVMPARSE
ncbi:MAG: DNA internalization-related competence protein ComEC/Rec2, partial [Marinobacter sp.]